MVDHQHEGWSRQKAIESIAEKLSLNDETARQWAMMAGDSCR